MKIYASYYHDLDQFAGEDLWVKIDYHMGSNYDNQSMYVKVLLSFRDTEFLWYEVQAVATDWVESPDCYFGLRECMEKARLIKEGDYSISRPMECYTTDEMLELLGDSLDRGILD